GASAPRRRVLVVCHANTSRSIIAEKVLERLLAEHGLAGQVEVRSGGIAPYARDGSLVSLDARLVLREVGIELPPGAGATDLKRQRHLLADADVIVVMTEQQRQMLRPRGGAGRGTSGRPPRRARSAPGGRAGRGRSTVRRAAVEDRLLRLPFGRRPRGSGRSGPSCPPPRRWPGRSRHCREPRHP